MPLFHNATLFGFCITDILNTGCAKIWKKIRRQKVKLAHYTSVTYSTVSMTQNNTEAYKYTRT